MKTVYQWLLNSASFGVIGAMVALVAQNQFDNSRERLSNSQTLVVGFYDSYLGGHRDRILAFTLEPEVLQILRGSPSEEAFARDMIEQVESRPDVLVSLLAVTSFYQAAGTCIADGRCDKGATLASFRPYANDFFGLMQPVLRHLDCSYGTDTAEQAVARFATVPLPPDDTC